MKRIIPFMLCMILFMVSSYAQINNLMTDDSDFFPEDIVIANDVAYVSGLGDGTIKAFDLTQENPMATEFAAAEAGYTQAWGVKSDGTILLSLLNNANFAGGAPGPAKLVEYDIASGSKNGEWDLPANTVGHTVSIVDGKYYVTNFGFPQIFEVDPSTGTVSEWFTSTDWDPAISGIGGTIYNNNGGFYISQGNKLWYLPISEGTPGTLQEVTVDGLDIIDADGISWDDTKNILYFATNDTGDPGNVGTASRVVFSDATTATGSIIASDFDDSSGLWFYRDGGKEYIFVLESQFGALFGINSFEAPFNIEVIELASSSDNTVSVYNSFEDATLTGGTQVFYGAAGPIGISDDVEFPEFINFYDIDVNDFGLTMTLFNNSDAADLLLPDGRFDRYYFALDQDMSNVSISGGSPGLTAGASVTPLPAGYTVPVQDLFGTGYPLPITLPNGGFVLELGGGTDLTELGQTISVDFGLPGVSVYNSFEDATLTGGQQAFYGAAGPVEITDDVEFPQFINFYDIDVNDCGLTMTLFNNSDAADLLLPDGRFDRYYFALDQDMSNVSISGGSPGLTAGASVTPLPAGYTVPVQDLFGTGYPLPITLPNGGFVLELGGGTDLTELGQTISVDFGCPIPEALTTDDPDFFPEDITIVNDVAYVSGLGDGTIKAFDLTESNPTATEFAAAEMGYTQAWGVKSDGTILLSLLNNANFAGGAPGPAKLVEYDIASGSKNGEWDLPANTIGHTVSIVDGKYYVTDFAFPQIFEVDPSTGTVSQWFTSSDWDPSISGIGGTIYNNDGAFYVSQGNKMWYLPISNGAPGTLQEVTVSGLDAIDADGISWVDDQNTLYYATNDTGDPANVGTVYKLVFSDATTATGSVIATGLDDSSGLWYYENDGSEYVFVLESQFGALFGLNSFEPPFNIEIIELESALTNEEKAIALQSQIATGDPSALIYVSDEQYIQHNLSIPSGKETLVGFYPGFPTGVTVDIHRSFEIGDYVILHTTFGGAWGEISGSGSDQVVFDVWRFEDGLMVEHWDNFANVVDDMDGTTQTDGAVTPATDLANTAANQALLEEAAQTLFVDGDWTNLRDYFDLDNYIQHSVGAGPDGTFLAQLEGLTDFPFYDEIKFIHTLGNFGLVMSQGPDITGQDLENPYAYYDLFRMENGKIVEHWDVIQAIPPQDQWANNNGKWGDDAIFPDYSCGGDLNTESVSQFFDEDLCIDGVGFDNNPSITLSGEDIPTGATISNVSLEAFFRLEGSSCESDIAIRLTDPAGNVHMINAFATCDGAGQLLQINVPIPSSYVTGTAGDWLIEFDDTNDQNSGCEYSVRFTRVNYDVNTDGVPVSNLVSEARDMNIFVDGVGFNNNPSITFADPGTPADAVLSNISLELFFRLNGNSCENEIALQLTDPAGNTQPLTAFATCNGGGELYFVNIAVPGGFTTGSPGDWTLQFDDTNDQNADYEYSPRFARLTYTTTQLEAGEATAGVVDETVSDIADSDLFIDGVGFYFNDNYTFTDPGTPADAQLSNISLELFFRLNGNSCENEIAMQLTDPAGNIQPLTAYTTCDGGSDLLSVTLDIPSGSTVGAPADWVLRFDDTNDQNADYEYSVRFGRLTYDVEYVACVPIEEEIEELQEPDDTFAGQMTETVNTQMKVYPVPAHQELNIDYFSENTSSINMQIFSSEGRLMMSEKGMLQQGANTFRLDIADLPAGHYYIHTFNEYQGVVSDKIIVIE